jgi:hypothetical protein
MVRTLNVKFDGVYVLEITVSGTEELVKTLTDDVWFNSMIRDGVKDLVRDKINKQIKGTK